MYLVLQRLPSELLKKSCNKITINNNEIEKLEVKNRFDNLCSVSGSSSNEQKSSSQDKVSPSQKLVKKLNFESRDEFPANNDIATFSTPAPVDIKNPFRLQNKVQSAAESSDNVIKKMKKRNTTDESKDIEKGWSYFTFYLSFLRSSLFVSPFLFLIFV